MKYFIPDSIDIDLLISQIPTDSSKLIKKRYLLYVLDLITSIPANNKALILKDGFVPINAKMLQRKVRNYRQYLEYLVANNILLINKQYIPGERSRGYKFAEAYLTPVRVISEADNKVSEVRSLNPSANLTASQRKKYDHLIRWYSTCFQIDPELALLYIRQDYERKQNNPLLKDCDEFTGKCKDPVEQYNSAFLNAEKFSRGAFLLNIDDFGQRIHSPLTNMRSELRNLLTYNKLQLASIDRNNSQPYLSTLLFNPSFWDVTNQPDVLTHKSVGLSLKEVFSSSDVDSFIMLCNNVRSSKNSDVHKYMEIVKSGTFYEYMAAQTQTDITDRGKLKAAVFQVLFTDNKFIGQESAAPKRKFREIFPQVYELFSLIKRKEKTNMPKLLQRIESHLILLTITKRISVESPSLPIFTVHDSIVTAQGYEQYVAGVMEQAMEEVIGFAPKLTISLWNPEKLQFKDGTPFNLVQSAA
jgi:hypothetical protein